MFKIRLNPQVNELASPVVSVQGDVLTINGEAFDFSQLDEGDELINKEELAPTIDDAGVVYMEFVTQKAIDSDYITGNVKRVDGYIELSLLLPLRYNSPQTACFPSPRVLVVETDGAVTLPDATPVIATAEQTSEATTDEQ